MSSLWFKRKRYGWGWVPVTWQGWLIILGYLTIVLGASAAFLSGAENQALEIGLFTLIAITATASLISISFKKGPSPKWRWGRQPDDDPEQDY